MAMLKLRDGRELEVAETVAEVVGATDTGALCKAVKAIEGESGTSKTKLVAADSNLVVLHEIRTTLQRKFPTPVDTKAVFKHQVIEHVVNLDHVIDMQPTTAEIKLLPVHDRVQAKMPAVSGPFKHDFDQHAFKFGVSELEEGRPVDAPAVALHGASVDGCDADLSNVGPYPKH